MLLHIGINTGWQPHAAVFPVNPVADTLPIDPRLPAHHATELTLTPDIRPGMPIFEKPVSVDEAEHFVVRSGCDCVQKRFFGHFLTRLSEKEPRAETPMESSPRHASNRQNTLNILALAEYGFVTHTPPGLIRKPNLTQYQFGGILQTLPFRGFTGLKETPRCVPTWWQTRSLLPIPRLGGRFRRDGCPIIPPIKFTHPYD